MMKSFISTIFFVMISMVTGCTQADRSDAGGRTQMADERANDPNALNKAGDPIIFDAIDRTELTQVQRLVESGADIEKQGFGNQTPALRAASARQWDICLYLLNQGANATVVDHSGITIPYLAFNSNILPTSYQGRYLAEVKEFLVQRNLDALNIPPKRVRELKSSGAWPPKAVSAR
ncbi:MAG: hypothetical protein VBE63_26460 [Lamprobacter sp.]|uniref:hypothetical protein n=1 Tax=Lamprobacter sp. TaxID=3100796 RepID=UPI002B25CA55|nr:hypothetical protein [Lamprobacter sp.]MEA3643448.1 hypothetical protein [Lamprobacter sp.]